MMQGDTTQQRKHLIRQENDVVHNIGIAYRAFYTSLSKITRQMWCFLKSCFLKKSVLQLYQRQFKPLVERYL